MKPDCMFFRDWPGQPNWCVPNWKECEARGQDCQDYCPKIDPKRIRTINALNALQVKENKK